MKQVLPQPSPPTSRPVSPSAPTLTEAAARLADRSLQGLSVDARAQVRTRPFGHAAARRDPDRLLTRLPVPAALEQVILDCLAKDPAARPASAAEVLRRLEEVGARDWTAERARKWWECHAAARAPEA